MKPSARLLSPCNWFPGCGSTATTFVCGFASFRRRPVPITVPPVPRPATKISMSGTSSRISAPVQTQFGWHLIKVEDKRVKAPPAFDVVKDRILQSLLLQKASKAAVDLRTKAKIEYVDADMKKAIEDRNKAIEQAPNTAPDAAKKDEPKKEDAKPEEKK